MSVRDCLASLVASGKVTKQVADSAGQMHERMQREFTKDAGPASADAAAALAAAKALRASSAEKIRNISAQVSAFKAGEQRLAEHPMGKMAALAGMITRDLWRDAKPFADLPAESLIKSGPNVEGKYKATVATLYQKFASAMQDFKPGFIGATKDQLTGVDNMIREIFGVDSGDATAKSAAKGWTDAATYAEDRARASGKIFTPLEDWRVPQFWRGTRVKGIGADQFKADIYEAADKGALTIWNKAENRPASMAERDDIMKVAYQDITNTGGGSAPFSNNQRTFQFSGGQAGADAYLNLQKKYGPGTNIMQMLTGHLDRMAHDIALTETFGPSYEANFRALFKQAKATPEIPTTAISKANPVRLIPAMLEGKGAVEGMWKVATGQVHPTHDTFMTSMLGALRNMNVASSLRQAVFSVLPTDSVTQLLAANHLGMDGIGHMARTFGGGVSKDDAQHLMIQAHSMMDYVNGIRDYDDHVSLLQTTGKFASGTVKATGLDQWGQVGKRTWAGDMLNLFSQQSDKAFADVNPKFKTFLDAYGFTEADWNKLRDPGMHMDLRGARYLNPNTLQDADRGLYERVMNAIQEQGAFAMHQPDFRLRGIESGAAFNIGPGIGAEVWRSLFQFKTFALSRMSTQMMRVLTDGPIPNRIARGLAFTALSTAAGAASIQALSIINGKDPEDMTKPSLWARAMLKGGAAGYYGELIDAAMRGQQSSADVLQGMAGPAVGVLADVARLATSPVREQFSDDQKYRQSTLGRTAINIAKRNTPNTWYTRLAVDRMFWDKLQTLVDPDYRKSWDRANRNIQKSTGAGFWWPQGGGPERAPDLGTALGH
jgi:hypothetical protein